MKAKTVHEAQFKPGGGPFKEPYAPYDHMSDLNDKKKNHRDAEGNVILEPFNFVTSPAKKGNPNNYPNTGFSKQHEYMPDPYSRKNDFAREELKRDIAKR